MIVKLNYLEDNKMTLMKRKLDDFSAFPSLFDNLWSRDWMDWNNLNFSNTNTTLPAVNVVENDDEFAIEMAAPGMSKGDFKIDLDGDILTIASEKKMKNDDKKKEYTRKEFSYQSFQRSFTLPKSVVDSDKVNASYDAGILRIIVPKREEAKPKPKREIKIS